LDAGTQFVLIPKLDAESAHAPGAVTAGTANNPHTEVPPLPDQPGIVDETEVCASPSCYVDFEHTLSETHDAELILPLKSLGYLPPPLGLEMSHFDFWATPASLHF
jgi:hypothetical protein